MWLSKMKQLELRVETQFDQSSHSVENIYLNVFIVIGIKSGHFECEDLNPKQHGHVKLSLALVFAIFEYLLLQMQS